MSDDQRHYPTTIQQHILKQQTRIPGASGEFSWLLSGLTFAAKLIEAKVRRAGLNDILGEYGKTNVQGERQQKLDVFANRVVADSLGLRDSVAVLASEENEQPTVLRRSSPEARYIIVFDPLDGSSNIDVNVSVGTTFSIIKRPNGVFCDADLLRPGREQVAAGYVLYGSSTMMVYSAGQGVHGFTLDPAIGAFVLSHENIRMPDAGTYYSVNEGYFEQMPEHYQRFIRGLRQGEFGHRYSARYTGSMVADFHRTLLKGGIFLYPETSDHPAGKLRLMYEASPVAWLAEQAGGQATDGIHRILDIVPEDVHDRIPLVVGSKTEMAHFENIRKASNDKTASHLSPI